MPWSRPPTPSAGPVSLHEGVLDRHSLYPQGGRDVAGRGRVNVPGEQAEVPTAEWPNRRHGSAASCATVYGGGSARLAAVATQVGHDHAMPSREQLDHRCEHLAGDHQPMHEQRRRRPGTAFGEVDEPRARCASHMSVVDAPRLSGKGTPAEGPRDVCRGSARTVAGRRVWCPGSAHRRQVSHDIGDTCLG